MNTPKNPKRYGHNFPTTATNRPDGNYSGGIVDAAFAQQLGQAIATWSFVEDRMIDMLSILLGPGQSIPSRQIYRTFSGASYRVRLMRTLLEQTVHNMHRGREYDEIIDEFAALNTIRNDYAHGLWWTHESGKMFLQAEADTEFGFAKALPVDVQKVIDFHNRCRSLHTRVMDLLQIEWRTTYAKNNPPQPSSEQPSTPPAPQTGDQ